MNSTYTYHDPMNTSHRHEEHTMSTTTPEALREEARQADQAAADSFDRCDTDGFLSQWASGMTARKLRAEAELLEDGGMIEARALFNEDGTVASTHQHRGQYGYYWVLNDAAAERFGKRFVSDETKAKTLRRKGFVVGRIRVAGHVIIGGSGTGLSGAMSAYVATVPVVDDLRAGRYEVLSTDAGEE